jgi:hypothetical protein
VLDEAVATALQAEQECERQRQKGKGASPLFFFAHALRGPLDDLGLSDAEAIDQVGRILAGLHPDAADPWVAAFPNCLVDAPVAFVERLRLIRTSKFQRREMLARAVVEADARPLPADAISRNAGRFKNLCEVLQEWHGSQPFPLSVVAFGTALGVHRDSITEYKKGGRAGRWLVEVKKAIPNRRAARYRFVVLPVALVPSTPQECAGVFKSVKAEAQEGGGADSRTRNLGAEGSPRRSPLAVAGEANAETPPPATATVPTAAACETTAIANLNAWATALNALGLTARWGVLHTDIDRNKTAWREYSMEALRCTVGQILQVAKRKRWNVIVRMFPDIKGRLIQLDDLSVGQIDILTPYAFLVTCTSSGNHQAWLAVQDGTPELHQRLIAHFGADGRGSSGSARLAGSVNFKRKYERIGFPTVEIAQHNTGKLTSVRALEAAGFVSARVQTSPQAAPQPGVSRPACRLARPTARPQAWPDYVRCVDGAPKHNEGSPDISAADFLWCRIAFQWGWSVPEVASELMRFSRHAQKRGQGAQYCDRTARKAAATVR